MRKIEQQKSSDGNRIGLSRRGGEQLQKILARAEYWYAAYIKSAGSVLALLGSMGATPRESEKFILDLAKVDMDSNSHFGILPATIEMLAKLGESEVVYGGEIMQLLIDSIVVDEDGYFAWNEDRRKRLARTLISYSRANRVEAQLGTETTCLEIIRAVRSSKKRIGLDGKTNLITQKSGDVEHHIPAEYFSSIYKSGYFKEKRVEFLRVGHLFFVDEALRRDIPQEVLDREGSNIIFVPDINETEFGDSLGYFTCNTIASLITANVEGYALIDCGSGSGILSAAALSLGAAVVLGAEYDPDEIGRAHKLALANGYTEGDRLLFVEADLRERRKIISLMAGLGAGHPVGVISNLGYWPDYPITNITNLAYIRGLREAGLQASLFIGGGYGSKDIQVYIYEEETALLNQLGLSRKELPKKDVDADRLILNELGFSVDCLSVSEPKIQSSFSAGSLVASL